MINKQERDFQLQCQLSFACKQCYQEFVKNDADEIKSILATCMLRLRSLIIFIPATEFQTKKLKSRVMSCLK